MQNLLRAIAVATVMSATSAAHATTYTYKDIDVPSARFGTRAQGINTTGAIAGTFQDGVASFSRYGFLAVNGAFTTIDNPNAQQGGTDVAGINDNDQLVGNYFTTTGGYNAFVYSNNTFRPVSHPDTEHGTVVRGINNMGSIVGEYLDANFVSHSFVNKGADFFPIDHARAQPGTTHVTGINNTGWESGYYTDARGTHGFLDIGGIFTTIDHPDADASGTIVTGVNAAAAATGYYNDATGIHGFVYQGGAFSPINVPGALSATYAMGINDNGVVTGHYADGITEHSFIATPDRAAIRTADFTSKLGVNTHIDYTDNRTFDSLDTVVTALRYLKLRNVRDSPTKASLQSWPYVAQRTGAKFNAYIPSGSHAHMKAALDLMPQLARAGLLNFIEGPNEEDNPVPISLGNSLSYSAQFQTWVFQVGRSLQLPVINMSFGSGWSEDNNWAGNYDKVGDLSAICDYANGHTFPEPGIGQPDLTFQMVVRNARMAASQRPVIHTEIGWDYRTPEADVPTAMLQGIFDAMQGGAARAYLYALFDEAGGHTFGLMNGNGTPKPEGVAFRNLMTLLEDTGPTAATFTPGALPYAVTKTTGGDRTYLMQKSNGTFLLAIWNEVRFRHPVTVTLDAAAAQIRVFNPVASTTQVQVLNNARAVTVDMVGAPLLLAITPGAPPAPASSSPAPTIRSSTQTQARPPSP